MKLERSYMGSDVQEREHGCAQYFLFSGFLFLSSEFYLLCNNSNYFQNTYIISYFTYRFKAFLFKKII